MDVAEFEDFFGFMHPRLVRYARRRLDPDTAGDVSAQALQTLWNKQLPAPVDDVAHRQLQSLAYRVVQGHINNALRAAARRGRIVERLADQHRAAGAIEPDVADRVLGAGDLDLPDVIERLSLTDREVLLLLADGYRVAEIAIILDCTPAAAGMRLRRAKDNLRLLLGRGRTHGTAQR